MKYLIAGLGNIGSEYAETRHNIGFKVLDALAAASNAVFRTERYGDVAEMRFKGRTFLLLKPSTYMNNSGNAVRYWLRKEKVEPAELLVVLDDLALPLGTIRMRAKGNDGGHNGLKSIDACIGTNAYPRLRCGIGHDFRQGQQVDYVLTQPQTPSAAIEQEKETLRSVIGMASEAVLSFGTQGVERTMNLFNKKGVGAETDKNGTVPTGR